MNPRERFITALNRGVHDRVPIAEHLFSLKLQKEILGHNTELYEGAAQTQLAAKLGIDMIWAPVNGFCGIEETSHKTTMVTGTPEDVKNEVLECLKIAAPGGGYIVSTDHSLHDDIPLENVFALIETVKKYGQYPINF